jgi:preprotein translocase subunit SecA
MAELLPRLQPQVVEQEEAERKEEATAAQESAGASKASAKKNAPVVKENSIGRNELVTITNGSETKELKYKKAEALLTSGWKLVEK